MIILGRANAYLGVREFVREMVDNKLAIWVTVAIPEIKGFPLHCAGLRVLKIGSCLGPLAVFRGDSLERML